MTSIRLLAAAGCLLLTDCGGNGPTEEAYQQLKEQNKVLTQQLDQCQNGPTRLLEAAQAALGRNDYDAAATTLRDLSSRHPTSDQAKVAQQLLRTATAGAKRAAAAQQAATAKEAAATERSALARRDIEARFRGIINSFQGEAFDATAFQGRMKREGFTQLGGEYSNDFEGHYRGHEVTIKYGGATASAAGWVQHWDVVVH